MEQEKIYGVPNKSFWILKLINTESSRLKQNLPNTDGIYFFLLLVPFSYLSVNIEIDKKNENTDGAYILSIRFHNFLGLVWFGGRILTLEENLFRMKN